MSKPNFSKKNVAGLLGLLFLPLASQLQAETVSTGFEGISRSSFTIGESPLSATFTGGRSQTIGNPGFYNSGRFAWHVVGGSSALVELESPASELSFFFRTSSSATRLVARFFDLNGEMLAEETATLSFNQVSLTRQSGESLIASVVFENTGSGDGLVDDLAFEAVPGNASPTAEQVDDESSEPGPGLQNPIAQAISTGTISIELDALVSGFAFPVAGFSTSNFPGTLQVVDQTGQIQSVNTETGRSSLFFDTGSTLVRLGASGPGSFDERGLLGLAFHPDYASNGLLYTYTSEPANGAADFSTLPPGAAADHQSVINEWQVTNPADPLTRVDNNTRRELLRLDQPQFNNNGGALLFDPSGSLYISLGDGGGADDTDGQVFMNSPIVGHGQGNAQDLSNPFGSILRIDPLGNNSANGRYGVPSNNPFIGINGVLPEIWAYGFRNPYRMSIDAATGEIWVADAGQNDIEEINLVSAGGNYGWNVKEGSFTFNANGNDDGFVVAGEPSQQGELTDPVAQYDHDEGTGVVGGHVYRGSQVPELLGRYVFGDFGLSGGESGRLFYLDQGNMIREINLGERVPLDHAVTGFGMDGNGEIYVLANDTGEVSGNTGVVYRLVADTDTSDATGAAPSSTTSPSASSISSTASSGGGVSLLSIIYLVAFAVISRGLYRRS